MSVTKRTLRYCQKQNTPHYCFFIAFPVEERKHSQVLEQKSNEENT